MHKKNDHCSFCGQRFVEGQPFPRTCAGCGNSTYVNPLPVSVVLVPVDGGLLTVRRAIPPRQGMLALPGGFIGMGESWQQAGAREVFEETGLRLDPAEVTLFDVRSAPDGTVLIFGLAAPRTRADLSFVANEEVSELCVQEPPAGGEPPTLAFPLHSQVAAAFFSRGA